MKTRAEQWMAAAREARDASGLCLRHGHYRSAVSRAYYAMFCAATAALLAAGENPRPAQGTWSHATLADVARNNLSAALGHGRAKDIRQRLRATRHDRVEPAGAGTDPSRESREQGGRRGHLLFETRR